MSDTMMGTLLVVCCILVSVLLGYSIARLQTEYVILRMMDRILDPSKGRDDKN